MSPLSITVGQITARRESRFEWLLDSLAPQIKLGEHVEVLQINLHQPAPLQLVDSRFASLWIHPIKPSVYQGPHKLTKNDVWDISGAKNTVVCLCKTEWICWTDDRAVVGQNYLQAIRDAIKGDYAVCGSYQKQFGMEVRSGRIVKTGEKTGADPRLKRLKPLQSTYGGEFFGCTQAMPLEWALEMNGWQEEGCAGIGLDDVIMGNRLCQNGHTTKFDPRLHIIEDRPRDPGEGMPIRADKGTSPFDKSHAVLERFGGGKWSNNQINLRAERERVLRGEPWTIPTEPKVDFWDGEPLEKMYVR